MVNFRFHVVSIVAVFLALALGIVMGTTVISENLVSQLRRDARHFALRSQQLRGEVTVLEREASFSEKFAEGLVPFTVKGRLSGAHVVLMIQDGAPDAAVDSVTEALRFAGASKPSRLRLTGDWSLTGESDRDRLGLATGSSSKNAGELAKAAASTLAERLSAAGDPSSSLDALRKISDAGFLKLDDVPAGLYPPPGALLVVIGSGLEKSVPDALQFLMPMLRGLAGKRATVVVEPKDSVASWVARLRADRDINDVIGSVDHVDFAAGQVSLVWALQAAANGKPAMHLGLAEGASGVAPPDLSAP